MTQEESTQAALLKMAQTIGGLVASVDTLTRQWRDQDEKASIGRRDLPRRRRFPHARGLVKAAISDIAEMKPIVDAVEIAKLKASGALTAARWIYWLAFGSGSGAAVLWVASQFFTVALK